MSTRHSLAMISAIAALGFASPVLAQSRAAVSGAELDAAVATRPAPRADAVRTLLSSDQAQAVAGQLGVGAQELSTRVAAMDAATLDQLAERAGVTDQMLAGGASNVVISTTAIIIILLILILLAS